MIANISWETKMKKYLKLIEIIGELLEELRINALMLSTMAEGQTPNMSGKRRYMDGDMRYYQSSPPIDVPVLQISQNTARRLVEHLHCDRANHEGSNYEEVNKETLYTVQCLLLEMGIGPVELRIMARGGSPAILSYSYRQANSGLVSSVYTKYFTQLSVNVTKKLVDIMPEPNSDDFSWFETANRYSNEALKNLAGSI
jgi:hypothetical protein